MRDAFIEAGHDAISCDLLPSERPGPHIQGDVRPLLREPWDLVIAHPPCTYLSGYSGHSTWIYEDADRWQPQAKRHGVPMGANAQGGGRKPTMHGYGLVSWWASYSCAEQPWRVRGTFETKRTRASGWGTSKPLMPRPPVALSGTGRSA